MIVYLAVYNDSCLHGEWSDMTDLKTAKTLELPTEKHPTTTRNHAQSLQSTLVFITAGFETHP